MKIFILLTISVILTLTQGATLNCTFEKSDYSKYPYTCTAGSDLITSENDREITEVIGEHLEGKNHDNVESLIVFSKISILFPRGVTKFFKNIQEVLIYNTKLEALTKDDLEQFGENLKRFLLYGNPIKVIEPQLFVHNKNLKLIEFQSSRVEVVNESAFDGLDKLEDLNLQMNRCTSSRDFAWKRENVLKLIKSVAEKCKEEVY